MPQFKSTGQPGYSSATSDRHLSARKREQQVQVQFAITDCVVQSREGSVHAVAGDAILTGTQGERWRVSKALFAQKYRPVPPTQPGQDGPYVSNPLRARTIQMQEAFDVLLADGRSMLRGATGDWLVDYGDGTLGIVAQDIFPTLYEILG